MENLKNVKITEIAFIAGNLTGRGNINLNVKDLYEAYNIFEAIYKEWEVGIETKIFINEAEEGYISEYAQRVLLERYNIENKLIQPIIIKDNVEYTQKILSEKCRRTMEKKNRDQEPDDMFCIDDKKLFFKSINEFIFSNSPFSFKKLHNNELDLMIKVKNINTQICDNYFSVTIGDSLIHINFEDIKYIKKYENMLILILEDNITEFILFA